jgi:acyl-CoA synthetase (AMP-forming)/AMP-acid ligase II
MVHALAYTDLAIDLGSLKYVNSGTAPLPGAVRDAFEQRYGVPVLQAYGSSEAGVLALETYEDALAGRRGPGSVGRPAPGVDVRIVDSAGMEVADGVEGEIVRRATSRHQAHFLSGEGISDLPTDATGWYATGDLGRMRDGILYVTGRLKEMMVVGGFNVYPAEVEEVLRESPEVRDAVVVALPDMRLGEVPAAGIVWADASLQNDATQTELLSQRARAALEPYKVPRRWFALPAVPLTMNGKVDRREAGRVALEQLQTIYDADGG